MLPGLIKAAIDSHDPRKIIELIPLIARTGEISRATIQTEIFNSYGKELNRNIFNQALRAECRKAAQEDRERTVQAVGSTWTANLIIQANGLPKPILANAITALQECPEWAGVLALNEFTSNVIIQQKPPLDIEWSARQPWGDQHDRLATEWLQRNHINVTVETAGQAVQTVAMGTVIHPVRDYLNSLNWDGESRIDRWVFRYLGVPQDDVRQYAAAVGKRFLVSAVARIFRPGCKADCAVILEGEQGIKKSTALKTLGGEWFTDEIAEFGSKDAGMQMRGVWIIELSELDSLNRSDVGRIKAFMSRTNDRFRPPYGKHVVELLRQCVFAGSVNNETYLRDTTGNRRFWPLKCGDIKIADLKRDRDQIWAEAVRCFKDGASWWLDDPELLAQAQSEQEARCQRDPWEDVIAKWIAERLIGHVVTVPEVLEHAIGKDQSLWHEADHVRVGKCLTAIGLQRKRNGSGERRWFYFIQDNAPISGTVPETTGTKAL
jgi:predicted P-loop ATPase